MSILDSSGCLIRRVITQGSCSLDKYPLLQQTSPPAKLLPIWVLPSNCHIEATALPKHKHYLISRQMQAPLRWWVFSSQSVLDVFHWNCDDRLETVLLSVFSPVWTRSHFLFFFFLRSHFQKGKIITLMQIWNELMSRILLNWLINEGTGKRLKSGQGAFEELGICRQYSTIAVIITGGVFCCCLGFFENHVAYRNSMGLRIRRLFIFWSRLCRLITYPLCLCFTVRE